MTKASTLSAKSYLSEADFTDGVLLRPVDFEVPGLGWVQVRGLSSIEIDDMTTKYKDKPILMAVEAVVLGLVTPKLSPAGVEALRNGRSDAVEAMSMRILELSGQGDKKTLDPLAGNGL